ncbi:MAG: M4 family metallopeptidase [Sphingobacteriales bacterium]|nr:M4 family metallopeptidase [Sphingobacteriales bacterium]
MAKLTLTLLTLLVFMAGCIAWGSQKTKQPQTTTTNLKQANNPLAEVGINTQKCPKVLQNNRNNDDEPYYFSYILDTSDPNCVAKTVEDLFGDGRLFPTCNDCTFKLERQNDKIKHYKQYYKGIEVTNVGFLIGSANDKIYRTTGTYYPNLNIDTTGMISREEAVKIAYDHAEIYEGFNTAAWQAHSSENVRPLINPVSNTIYYAFYIPKITKKNGGYFVNATNGKFIKYVPDWGGTYLTDCYKCVGNATTMFNCQDTCSTNICTVFTDGVMVGVPTLYNGCQTILADECNAGNKIVYRMAPDTTNLTINDSINIYDGSKYYGGPKVQKIFWCYTDSSISKKNTIATTAWHNLQTSRNYFATKAIDYKAPLKALVHFPESPFDPFGNEVFWDQKLKHFGFGSGDDTIMTAPVSIDIVAHEYAHAILFNKFSMGNHITHDTATLRYQAGAIHEGVADIFSTLVRKHAFGIVDWVIGDAVVIPAQTDLLPRDLAHPENTLPPQALYYNNTASNWDTTAQAIYNHAGIVAKWFYLLADGGTGFNYATDSITVEPLTIDTAEMVLINGLQYITDTLKKPVPSYEDFAKAMVAAAQAISCTAHKQTIRAFKAVGLGLNIPGGKKEGITDDELCFIDLRMRDRWGDQGFEPNTECDDILGWNDIWNSPDIWVCPQNDSCYLAGSAPPEPAYSNCIGFTIYNAHPNLGSDPAQLHLYYTMASSGEIWDFNWVDWYFDTGNETCYLGDEIVNSPVEIPAINPNDYFTGWTTWSPPNFVNPDLPFYADPVECWLTPELDPLDGQEKYEICLLARLLSDADPLPNEIEDNITHNIIYHNNIVTKNLFFLNPGLGIGGGVPPAIAGNPSVLFISNNNATAANLNIVYQQLTNGLGLQGSNDSIEISLVLSPQLWDNWVSTGQQGQGITWLTQREVRIDDYQTAKLLNIPFAPYERQPIAIKTTILTGGNKTINYENYFINGNFSFYLTHQAAFNQPSINPSTKCIFVLKNNPTANTTNPNDIQLVCSPNPVKNGYGKLLLTLPTNQTITITLYNLQGNKVQQVITNQQFEAGLYQIPLSIANLANGIYICQLITTNNQNVAAKVIKLNK